MRTLVWTRTFVRAFRKAVRRQPDLRTKVQRSLEALVHDPYEPALHSHKLKGKLAGAWACTVDYHHRILFQFTENPDTGEEEILRLTMGTHDEVY